MSLALALSLALLTQQAATTQVIQANGTMQFQLYWDFDDDGDALILELSGAAITDINSTKPPQAVSMNFKDIQLNLPPAQNVRSPYLCILSNQNGTAGLYYQYTAINYGLDNATLNFSIGGAYPDLMAPYSFLYFNYGAYQSFTLYPTSGNSQDIASVLSGKLEGVSGTGTFQMVLSPFNTALYPPQWLPKYWPAVRY